MLIEFVGGSLDGQQRTIDQYYWYMNTPYETYAIKSIRYEKLNWIYIWYQVDQGYEIKQ